jgi:hypothetical protein
LAVASSNDTHSFSQFNTINRKDNMSHFTEIKTQIKDIEALRLACQELGLTDRNWVFCRPAVLSAARVWENWFSLLLIPGPILSGRRFGCKGFFSFILGSRRDPSGENHKNT